MAPSKPAGQSNRSGLSTMVTRMRAAATTKNVAENNLINKNKRKAETALTSDKQKRSAFGDLTNVSNKISLRKKLQVVTNPEHTYRPSVKTRMPRKLPKEKQYPFLHWVELSLLAPQPNQLCPQSRKKSKFQNL